MLGQREAEPSCSQAAELPLAFPLSQSVANGPASRLAHGPPPVRIAFDSHLQLTCPPIPTGQVQAIHPHQASAFAAQNVHETRSRLSALLLFFQRQSHLRLCASACSNAACQFPVFCAHPGVHKLSQELDPSRLRFSCREGRRQAGTWEGA